MIHCLAGYLEQELALAVVWKKKNVRPLPFFFFFCWLIQETAELTLVKATNHGFEQRAAEKSRVKS